MEARYRELIAALGICPADQVGAIRPLSGGVASDIAVVEVPGRRLCVKFARARLAVAEEWLAPVERSRAEYAWLSVAAEMAPRNVPRLEGWSSALNGFAMEYIAGDDVTLWKAELLAGRGLGHAAEVAAVLGRIHAASTAATFAKEAFANRDDFHALRLDPYLLFTAGKHPDLAPPLQAMAWALHAASRVLVHGDLSPKNVLIRAGVPVILDAECATMGDAAFDIAFCLNHLALKSIHLGSSRLPGEGIAFWKTYRPFVSWEDAGALETRVAALLPMLMLARVDGKSPVEYLTAAEQDRVRALATSLIAAPRANIAGVFEKIEAGVARG